MLKCSNGSASSSVSPRRHGGERFGLPRPGSHTRWTDESREEKNLAGTAEPLKISSSFSLVGESSPSHLDDSLHDRKCPL